MRMIEAIKALRSELTPLCDKVAQTLIYPQEEAEIGANNRYASIILADAEPSETEGSRTWVLTASIIGIIKTQDEDIAEMRDDFMDSIASKLYRNPNAKLTITRINVSNALKSFGFEAGVFPPYAAFEIMVAIPFDIR